MLKQKKQKISAIRNPRQINYGEMQKDTEVWISPDGHNVIDMLTYDWYYYLGSVSKQVPESSIKEDGDEENITVTEDENLFTSPSLLPFSSFTKNRMLGYVDPCDSLAVESLLFSGSYASTFSSLHHHSESALRSMSSFGLPSRYKGIASLFCVTCVSWLYKLTFNEKESGSLLFFSLLQKQTDDAQSYWD